VSRDAGWHDIAPAKPMPNGVVERLIGWRRDDRLDEHLSPSPAAAHAELYISGNPPARAVLLG
jgi:hypothetical protein